jgi:hypothetical protein
MLFNRLTGHGDWWLSGSGTTLVAVDYVGRPWEYRQATIEDTDGQMAAGYVRAWVPVGGSYAFLTGLITSGTVQWPVKATGEWDRSSRCVIADQNRPDAAEVSVNLAGPQLLKFNGCLDDCAIAFGLPGILYRGCPVMPRIWGEFTLAMGLDQVQGSAALPTEDELEPEFRIEENWLFLPMIQVPAD